MIKKEIVKKSFNSIGLKYIEWCLSTSNKEDQEEFNEVLFGLYKLAYEDGWLRGHLKGTGKKD